jgi:hypothetical protein
MPRMQVYLSELHVFEPVSGGAPIKPVLCGPGAGGDAAARQETDVRQRSLV